MTTAADVLKKVGIQLNDEDAVRWKLPELIGWINAGVRAILIAKPSEATKSFPLALAIGTHQRLPDNHDPELLALVNIARNLQSMTEPYGYGRAIRPTTRDMLDVSSPNWHSPAEFRFKKEVRQYTFDEAIPREFFVFPGNDGTGIVEAVCTFAPAKIAATGPEDALASYETDIPLPSIYEEVLMDYVIFRALSRDDLGGDAGRAMMHLQAFTAATGQKIQTEAANSPNGKRGVTEQ